MLETKIKGQITYHPIIFSTESVRAILDGRKTQTRRLINPQPFETNLGYKWKEFSFLCDADIKYFMPKHCRYGQVGDRLWVKETWRPYSENEVVIEYKADGTIINYPKSPSFTFYGCGERWHPSIFMPRSASRTDLEITDVRVERVQDINLNDCKAEGIGQYTFARGCCSEQPPDARWKFIELWNSLNAKRGYGWERNPYVWCISFKKLNKIGD